MSNCFARIVYTTHKKQHILHFYSKGYKAPTIQKFLAAENLLCSHVGIARFIKVFEYTKSICRQPGSGRPSKVTRKVEDLVEQQVRLDDKQQLISYINCSLTLATASVYTPSSASLGFTRLGLYIPSVV